MSIEMKNFYENLCDNLKQLRVSANYTQLEVADYLGISRANYGRYETGKRNIPLDIISKLAKFYGITVDEMLN